MFVGPPVRILITGGAGFIGSHLVDRLVGGGGVLVVDDLSRGRREHLDPRSRLAVADVADPAALAAAVAGFAPTLVFHLAARHYIPECDAHPRLTARVNVGGTRALLELLTTAPGPRPSCLVLASSAAVYAPADEPHREGDRLGPLDVYGRSKVRAEALVSRFSRATGTPVVIARLFNVYGPRETNPHVIPEVLGQIGGPGIRVGNLSPMRDYVHVRDVASALEALAGAGVVGGRIVNVGTGRATSVSGLVRTLASIEGHRLVVRRDPDRKRSRDRPRLVADSGLLAALVGWQPHCALEEGLAELVAQAWDERRRWRVA